MLSREDYSFVAMRCLRRIVISNNELLYELVSLLMSCLNHSSSFIDWVESDETMATQLSAYIQRNKSAGWAYKFLHQYVYRINRPRCVIDAISDNLCVFWTLAALLSHRPNLTCSIWKMTIRKTRTYLSSLMPCSLPWQDPIKMALSKIRLRLPI